MKFGEQLSTHLTPEWRKQYIEYNRLKRMLYEGMADTPNVEGDENARYLAKVDEAFFTACQEELVKVNLFFGQKLAEAQGKFFELSHDLEVFKGAGRASRAKRSFFASPLRFMGMAMDSQHRTSAKTASQLKLAFSEFYLGLVLLQNYQQLNATGFRKILKKRDKLFTNTKGLEWRQANVEKAAFFLTREIDSLINRTENVVINDLEGGDRSSGMKRLRVPPLSEVQSAWTTYRLGLFTGAFLVLFGLILLKVQVGVGFSSPISESAEEAELEDKEELAAAAAETGQPKWLGVRLFRGYLLLFANLFLMGLNMYGWQMAGVNHVLIFEMDPRQHLTYQGVMETAYFFGVVWALAVLGFLFAPQLNCSPLLFPLLLTLFLLIWMLNPLKHPDFTHRSSRMWFLRRVFHCLSAPFHYVTFADFWLADQMNSCVTIFLDLEYLVCFYATEVHYDLAAFSVEAIPRPAPNSTIGIDFATGADQCSTNAFGIRPLVSLIPAVIRFLQCFRRFRDTKKKNPHLVNAGKYFSSWFVIIIGSLNTHWYHDVSNWQSPLFYPWLGAYLVSFVYAYTWDIRMDWGLLELRSAHPLLRDELVYDAKPVYYAAIVGDFILRLGSSLPPSLSSRGGREED